MPEYSTVDTYQITLTGGVDAIDPSKRGGSAVVVKNMAASNKMYVGPAVNLAGSALSSTTGYELAGGESLSLDLTVDRGSGNSAFSVIGTASDKLSVIVLKP